MRQRLIQLRMLFLIHDMENEMLTTFHNQSAIGIKAAGCERPISGKEETVVLAKVNSQKAASQESANFLQGSLRCISPYLDCLAYCSFIFK
jgi:hypothetical protein